MEQILVSLSVKLRSCVFEGDQPCGDYGVCQEIRKGLLYYTACKCFGGKGNSSFVPCHLKINEKKTFHTQSIISRSPRVGVYRQ